LAHATTLVVELSGLHPGNWCSVPGQPVLPATVAAGIQKALVCSFSPRHADADWASRWSRRWSTAVPERGSAGACTLPTPTDS